MIFNDLQQASWRGVNFLTPNNKFSGGRKTITHEFVNSDERYVEDLGLYPGKFKITMIIHGDDAIQRRNTMIAQLNKPGPGTLVHPSYGAQLVALEGQYQISESEKEIGVYKIDCNFALSDQAIFPNPTVATKSTISSAELTARTSVLSQLSQRWEVPKTTPSINDASQNLTNYADQTLQVYQKVLPDFSEINQVVSEIKNNANQLIQSGQGVSDSISSIFDSIDNIATESKSTLSAITSFLDFSSQNPLTNAISADQISRQLNQGIFDNSIQALSLIKSYATSTQVDFTTSEELFNTRTLLSSSTKSILQFVRNLSINFDAASNSGLSISNSEISNEINNILNVRSKAEEFYSSLEQNLYRVGNARQNFSSANLLSYALFESLENVDFLADLNRGKKPSFFSGELEILTK